MDGYSFYEVPKEDYVYETPVKEIYDVFNGDKIKRATTINNEELMKEVREYRKKIDSLTKRKNNYSFKDLKNTFKKDKEETKKAESEPEKTMRSSRQLGLLVGLANWITAAIAVGVILILISYLETPYAPIAALSLILVASSTLTADLLSTLTAKSIRLWFTCAKRLGAFMGRTPGSGTTSGTSSWNISEQEASTATEWVREASAKSADL